MKFSEAAKIAFKVTHTTLAIICLSIIGIYIFEKNILSFDDYADIYAILPSTIEFEGDEPVTFFVLSDNTETFDVNVRQILMCDYGDENGFGYISSQESIVELEGHNREDATIAKVISNTAEEDAAYINTANTLRTLVRTTDVANFIIYDGGIPRETSQCFVKFKFSTETRHFGITKYVDKISYPFDYAWYFQSNYGDDTRD